MAPVSGRVCYRLEVTGLPLAGLAAHLHRGPAGAVGPRVAYLAAPDGTGVAAECLYLRPEDAAALAADPSGYYVDVHAPPGSGGPVRGQLGP